MNLLHGLQYSCHKRDSQHVVYLRLNREHKIVHQQSESSSNYFTTMHTQLGSEFLFLCWNTTKKFCLIDADTIFTTTFAYSQYEGL